MIKVQMQYVENYADDTSENYWKFKGGADVGVFFADERPANVIAALMEKDNGRHSKMIPMSWEVLGNFRSKEDYECDHYLMYNLNSGDLEDVITSTAKYLIGAGV